MARELKWKTIETTVKDLVVCTNPSEILIEVNENPLKKIKYHGNIALEIGDRIRAYIDMGLYNPAGAIISFRGGLFERAETAFAIEKLRDREVVCKSIDLKAEPRGDYEEFLRNIWGEKH